MDKLFLGDEEGEEANKVRMVCEQRQRGMTQLPAKCGTGGFTEYHEGVCKLLRTAEAEFIREEPNEGILSTENNMIRFVFKKITLVSSPEAGWEARERK